MVSKRRPNRFNRELTTETDNLLSAIRLKPAADIDLGVSLAAVMAGAALVGDFLVPLKHRQFGVAAVDHDPPDRVLALLAADFTSITRFDHSNPQRQFSVVSSRFC